MQIYNSTTEQTASVKEDVIWHDRSFHSVMEDWGTAGPETAEVGGTYRLQLVHEFDQELSALWRFTVQLHACLHSIEPACRTGEERWKENRIKPLFYCSVNSIPLQPRSKVWLSHAEDSLHRVLMNLSLRGGRPPPPDERRMFPSPLRRIKHKPTAEQEEDGGEDFHLSHHRPRRTEKTLSQNSNSHNPSSVN